MVAPVAEPLADAQRYEKIKDLNSGAHGFVQLVRDKATNEYVAVKFIPRGDKISGYVESEILNHRSLNHPHVVQFREVFLTPHYLGIAMEYAAGGDLFDYAVSRHRRLQEDHARWFFQQLVVALDYCHRMGIANRDIKLENTLLDHSSPPLIKLCDFGYSKHAALQSAPGSLVGTPAYLAPEVLACKKGQTYDGKAADVWSSGVMLYTMLTGSYPFERPEDKTDPRGLHSMYQRIQRVEYSFPAGIAPSQDLQDLLSKMLVADPARRIKIPEIYTHPWYTRHLPQGVLQMNDTLEPVGDNVQSVAEIRSIVQEARSLPGALGSTQGGDSQVPLTGGTGPGGTPPGGTAGGGTTGGYTDDAYDDFMDAALGRMDGELSLDATKQYPSL